MLMSLNFRMKILICPGIFVTRRLHLFQNLTCQFSNMAPISTVFVKQPDQEDTMKITFVYQCLELPSQNFTFQRLKSESLGTALCRIKSKIQSFILQKTTKKRKKKSNIPEVGVELPSISIILQRNGARIPDDVENRLAWSSESEMIINEHSYKISVNPPTVNLVSLPKCILSDSPVFPKVSLDFCSLDECIFSWYRNVSKDNAGSLEFSKPPINKAGQKWDFVSEGFIYHVKNEDAGHKLLVSCIPSCENKTGLEESAISLNVVTAGPNHCPFEDRHCFTKESTKTDCFRCVSYNILADLYADTETARNDLFPYCPADALAVDYRKALYLKEIAGYNADVICLQEVDKHIFYHDLVPFLSKKGLNGVFNTKGGQVAEGLSCFYRESKFKLIESHSVILAEAIKNEPVLQHLCSTLDLNEKLAVRFLNRTTSLQVTLLESLDDHKRRVLVGNTHLYFHPESDNIRLLQAACCIVYLESQLHKYQQETSSSISLLFCGDFNSCPEFGVYALATKGFLHSDCIDWKSNAEEQVAGLELKHSLVLDSACGTPQYTNFTSGFVGCLDYIFYDKSKLEVIDVVPLPSHKQVIEHIALPNKVFPSDHLALVCTLLWKQNGNLKEC